MSEIDWGTVAPKLADWERLAEEFTAAGLPPCRFRNGIPIFNGTDVDWELVARIALGERPSPVKVPDRPPDLAQPPEQSPEQPVKRGRGRPKKS